MKIKNYNTKYFNEPRNRSNILIKELFKELINAPGRLLNVPNLRTTNSELFEIVLLRDLLCMHEENVCRNYLQE